MRMRMILIVLPLLILNISNIVRCDVGTAMSYSPPYTPTKCNGDNEQQFPANKMFAAVGDGLWDNGAACGRRYRLRCLSGPNRPCKGGAIVVQVVDRCNTNTSPNVPCSANLVLSIDAFQAVSRFIDTKINVEFIQI